MRTQIVALNLLSVAGAARPGAIVEASSYTRSSEALVWGTLIFHLVPNETNVSRPYILDLLFRPDMKHEDRITGIVYRLASHSLALEENNS
ncbi:hypothetical protein BDP27DRAFT_1446050 [Rhodocollybia butyracea]|uniref:Uncharacterized protein n=1 Tax=Rhodocollybia butyracea TaxID=206335 RepID=A0A9P5PXR4_9AGAR|nr:hypothetical protein BDP27DRAFT_1446050 [Rhodocollybia butyracea]